MARGGMGFFIRKTERKEIFLFTDALSIFLIYAYMSGDTHCRQFTDYSLAARNLICTIPQTG